VFGNPLHDCPLQGRAFILAFHLSKSRRLIEKRISGLGAAEQLHDRFTEKAGR